MKTRDPGFGNGENAGRAIDFFSVRDSERGDRRISTTHLSTLISPNEARVMKFHNMSTEVKWNVVGVKHDGQGLHFMLNAGK